MKRGKEKERWRGREIENLDERGGERRREREREILIEGEGGRKRDRERKRRGRDGERSVRE